MKPIFFVTILVVLQLSQVSGLTINDPGCNKYLEKFGTVPGGVGASKIAFTGDVAFVPNTANAKVNLKYSDVDLYNDKTYFGLVKEDGKTADQVCLELRLSKHTSNTFSDPVLVTDLAIKPLDFFQSQWRGYTFTIPGTELRTRLVETSNSDQFIYKGYYSIAFYAAGSTEVQYTFFFEFSVTVTKANGAAVETGFKPLSYQQTLQCQSGNCNAKAETQLKWCADLECIKIETPDLHLNDQFILQQIITTEGMSEYFLTGTEVWYIGNGLNKKATPVSIVNKTKGQVIIQLKAEIAWSAVTIRVTSTLANAATGRRLLAQSEFGPVNGETSVIECIKAEGAETCAGCLEECDANGFAHDGCEACSFSQQIAFVFLALLLVFTI